MAHTSTHPHDPNRVAGVLLHPTSLPGRYGIGDVGDELVAFLDWTASAGMRLWQVLPLNPPGYGHSPYGCLSSFAGNPLLISPQRLLQDGMLAFTDVEQVPEFSDAYVDWDRVIAWKEALLRTAFRRFQSHGELDAFIDAEREWLDDYALFATLKKLHGGAPWWQWPRGLSHRHARTLERARREHAEDIRFHQFEQYVFFRQWRAVRDAATARGIRIVGDVPIYVACDSADVWAHRRLFQLDDAGQPSVVAGVPPDYFSATGQRWGNPLYRWDLMRENNYAWWVARVRANLRFADLIRLDHFRGFAAYWEIPANEPTAIHGRWMPGPGRALFDAIRQSLGSLPVVAEDLGFITEDVHELRRSIGVPGMRILQFAFGDDDSPHLPHFYEPETVVYTGTHDNDTAIGWYQSVSDAERARAREYLGCEEGNIAWGLIRMAYASVAQTAIVPMQDVLSLGSDARMNTPGAAQHNWAWRMLPGAATREHAERLRKLAAVTGRI